MKKGTIKILALLLIFGGIEVNAQNENMNNDTSIYYNFMLDQEAVLLAEGKEYQISEIILFLNSESSLEYFNDLEIETKKYSFVKFIIEKDGTVSNIEPIKHAKNQDPIFDEKIIEFIKLKMTKWKPGYKSKKPVRNSITIPFILSYGYNIEGKRVNVFTER